MTVVVSMKMLLEAGVHFGHQTRRWNPKMKDYIFTQRNGIHIIDLEQTAEMLKKACAFIRDVVAGGEEILFVGTKKQAQEAVAQEAQRCGMHWVNQRWLGGMFTNFATIQKRIDYLVRLEDRKAKGGLERLPKKTARKLEEELVRLNRLMGGVKAMTRLPGAIFVIDPGKEYIAVSETRRMAVPIVAVVDTNCNPENIDYVVPANDDAIKSVRLLCSTIADAVLEGKTSLQAAVAEEAGEMTPEALAQVASFAPEPDNTDNGGTTEQEGE